MTLDTYCWRHSIGTRIPENRAYEMMQLLGIPTFAELYNRLKQRGEIEIDGLDVSEVVFCDCGNIATEQVELMGLGGIDDRNGQFKDGKPILYDLCSRCISLI